MTAAENLVRKVKPELEAAVAALEGKADPEHITKGLGHIDRALDVLRAAAPKKGKRKELDLPGKTRRGRREERNERAAQIRAIVMRRADGKCEWCGREGFVLQWAHVIDGNGSKTAHEDVDTTAAACADCHLRGWHRGEVATLNNAKAWAIRYGFRDALTAINKKIAKVEEARLAVRSDKP